MNIWELEMGKTVKIERIGDMFQLLWLESVITEASLMTRNIKLHSILMNWMCFHCRSGGALPPPPKTGGSGAQRPPSQNRKIFEKMPKYMFTHLYAYVKYLYFMGNSIFVQMLLQGRQVFCTKVILSSQGWRNVILG